MSRDARERLGVPLAGIARLLIGGRWLPVAPGRLRYLDRHEIRGGDGTPIYEDRTPVLVVLHGDDDDGVTAYRLDQVQGYTATSAVVERQDGPGQAWIDARPPVDPEADA